MLGDSARYRTSAADGGPDPPRPVSLAPDYRRRIARLEDLPANASGADESWAHRAPRGRGAPLRVGEAAPDPLASLASALSASGVRYPVIGAWGANYYAPSGSAMFTTLDRDFFLPP